MGGKLNIVADSELTESDQGFVVVSNDDLGRVYQKFRFTNGDFRAGDLRSRSKACQVFTYVINELAVDHNIDHRSNNRERTWQGEKNWVGRGR